MNIKVVVMGALVIGICLGGILVNRGWVRVLLWLLSTPFALIGLLALAQGGLAEKMDSDALFYMSVFLFLPILSCAAGQFRIKINESPKPPAAKHEGAFD